MADPERGWVTRQEIAALLDVTLPYFDREVRPLIPAADVRRQSRPHRYRGRAVIDAWVRKEIARNTRSGPRHKRNGGGPTDSDDPLLVGASSPALERYRSARAEAAELDLDVRRGRLVEADSFRVGVERIAAILREAGESMERSGFREARDMLVEAIDDAEVEIVRMFADEVGDEVGDEEPARAEDA